jgi:hypothetical protein
MSKQRILMMVALCFVLIGTVAAGIPHDPKPDSVVGCLVAGGQYQVFGLTIPESIDESSCTPLSGNSCSPCIRSLENQGCEVVEPVQHQVQTEPTTVPFIFPFSTFVLSCAQP